MRKPIKFKKVAWSMHFLEVFYDDGESECLRRDDMSKELAAAYKEQCRQDVADREAWDCRAMRAPEGSVAGGLQVIARDPNKHDSYRTSLLYGKDSTRGGNPDLKSKVAEKEWERYIPGQGPMPFRTTGERREYLRKFGFTEH